MSKYNTHIICAYVTVEEYEVILKIALRDELSIANFIRRCINSVLLESGDEGLLITETDKLNFHQFSKQHVEKAIELYRQGFSIREISRYIEVSPSNIAKWVKGVPKGKKKDGPRIQQPKWVPSKTDYRIESSDE